MEGEFVGIFLGEVDIFEVALGFPIEIGLFSSSMKTWYQWSVSKKGIKCFLIVFFIQGLIWIVYPVLKYYSFNLFTLDAGYHSNILYNISKGDFYSSIFNMQSLGEHFTFSMSIISLFYLLVPSINWMMGFKVIAYLISVVIIWMLSREWIKDKNKEEK